MEGGGGVVTGDGYLYFTTKWVAPGVVTLERGTIIKTQVTNKGNLFISI